MSEDTTEVQETPEDESAEEARSKIDDLETARKEIDKLRRENAKRRVEGNEYKKLAEDASKWQEHLESQKSEMERLVEAKATLEEEVRQTRRALMQRDLVAELGLDPDLAEFITGDDEDEMRAKAEKLASKGALKKTSGPTDLKAGDRGAPVVSDEISGGKFLEFLADKARQ